MKIISDPARLCHLNLDHPHERSGQPPAQTTRPATPPFQPLLQASAPLHSSSSSILLRRNQCFSSEGCRFTPRRTVRMKTKTLLALSVVLFGTALAASAGTSWSVSIGVGVPSYYYPAPVVVVPALCPPPRVVYAPPVVCYPPLPVCPPPRFVPPGHAWGQHNYWKGHGRYDRHDDRHAGRRGHGGDRNSRHR
jgi:hypothetical protein